MRRILLLLTLMFALQIAAQEPRKSNARYYIHEMNVSAGGIRVRSGWSNDYERSVMNLSSDWWSERLV